jgi:hypothetical protein
MSPQEKRHGVMARIRTSDLRIERPTLYHLRYPARRFIYGCVYVIVCYRSDDPKKHDHDYDDEEDEEILGSDDDEQEDPRDYCKGG